MENNMLTDFFLTATLIGLGLMVFTALLYRIMPDLTFKSQKIFFPGLTKEQFRLVMYGFLGFFKIMILVLFAIPYITLLIIN